MPSPNYRLFKTEVVQNPPPVNSLDVGFGVNQFLSGNIESHLWEKP